MLFVVRNFRELVQGEVDGDVLHVGNEFLENERQVLLQFGKALGLREFEVTSSVWGAVEDPQSRLLVELELLGSFGNVADAEVVAAAVLGGGDLDIEGRFRLMTDEEVRYAGLADAETEPVDGGKGIGGDAKAVGSFDVPGDVHGRSFMLFSLLWV